MASHESGPGFYGPGSGYNCFSGRDATMLFAKMELDASKLPSLGTTMTPAEEKVMLGWVRDKSSGGGAGGLFAGTGRLVVRGGVRAAVVLQFGSLRGL